MTYKGKNKLYILIGLTIVLVIQGILFLTYLPEARFSLLLMISLIIIIALLSIALSYVSLKKINERIVNLPDPYKKTYINACEIIGTSSMKSAQKKEVSNMILEIFEEANYANRSIDEVIGNNLTAYMNGFLDASGGDHTPLYLFSFSSFLYVLYLLSMKLYVVLKPGDFTLELLKSETLDFGIIFVYAIIAYAFFPWMLVTIQKAAKEQWTGVKRIQVILPFLLPFGLIAAMIFIDHPDFIAFIDQPVHIFSSIYSLGFGIILAIGLFILMKYAQLKQYKSS